LSDSLPLEVLHTSFVHSNLLYLLNGFKNRSIRWRLCPCFREFSLFFSGTKDLIFFL